MTYKDSTPQASAQLEVLALEVPYVADPTELYYALCGQSTNSLLLESAEVDSKQNLKSLMLIDAAVRIVCRGHQVDFEALTLNGENVLASLVDSLDPSLITQQSRKTLTLSYLSHHQDTELDEDSRLRQASNFDALRAVQQLYPTTALPHDALFLAGLFAYDLVAAFEPLPEVDAKTQCPDYVFYVAETLLVMDHQKRKSKLQASLFSHQSSEDSPSDSSHYAHNYHELSRRIQAIKEQCLTKITVPPAPVMTDLAPTTNVSDEQFCQQVNFLKQHVIAGDIFQVVPSRQFTLPCPDPLAAYRALKQGNPSPYMFYLRDQDFTLFGASPESALKYSKATNQVEIYPIAGTRPRGKNRDGSTNLDLDGRIELELRCDVKEKAEHMMLVDLARNDVARISEPGSRYVADLLKVDRYSHVMHLVSRVVGQLRSDLDALHAYQACMNMGTLTGAPKIRAMQLIRQVEQQRRGSYGGAVGYLTGTGDMDTCIVIRSAYVENEVATVQAGAGVVYDSIPQAEADETRAKAQAVIRAIQQAHSSSANSLRSQNSKESHNE
ncbi:anthranilate synthase component I [Photobacterium damselae]|uniref:Anthranilate synthase component I n=1 Tax=Photobacterium damselae TaxID=38293 RepID=A0ACD3T6G9_PHODM|nr:anthranilate synthase component 1 [Photobacterium damselae]RDL28736.1 anthranilate synthase component I [Photobacterium damselae]TMX54998.1 anthranilate synthase component I [Photobacterium damselae]TMX70169.1 anthranilate synthase component I [Photobacterium damselae]TMX78342.1 anthranilate synthase component I [Photobacterium damselae]